MANAALFATTPGPLLPRQDVRNHAGGTAYALPAKAALAQLAATGCLRQTYYASAQAQLAEVLTWLSQIEPRFIAQVALHCRESAAMKDMPALLLAWLAQVDGRLGEQVFERVVDNGRMLRNFVQILRSGVVGRKSLGSRPKRWVQRWLERASTTQLLQAAVGQQPALADVVKMVHPRAVDAGRNALYAWLIGRPYDVAALPQEVREFEDWKAGRSADLPRVPWQLLTALPLDTAAWTALAARFSWQTLRMNLNTLLRHGVLEDRAVVQAVAARLSDRRAIRNARAQPYQLLNAWSNADVRMPHLIVQALEDAMEIAIDNVPQLPGQTVVLVDVSGSMQSPLTGVQRGATSKLRCIDVAALLGAALNRRNADCVVLPFAEVPKPIRLNARDSVTTQAERLVALGGGGTAIGAAMAWINAQGLKPQTVIVVSDNESWADTRNGASRTLREFAQIQRRQPTARLVCLDLQPYATTQAPDSPAVLNVGGFSDAAFGVIAQFAHVDGDARHWVEMIEAIEV